MADGGRAPGAGGEASMARTRAEWERRQDPLGYLKRQAEEERAKLVLPNGEPAFLEDGSPNPKGSLAGEEKTHTREVISKFGGIIKAGPPVAIPPQTWNGTKEARTMYARDANFLALHPDSYRSRYQATHVVASSGVAGYTGHQPQNPTWSIPHRRPDLRSSHLSPNLEDDHAAQWENYPPQMAHYPDHTELHQDALPAKMRSDRPIPPGYTGHMAKVKTGAQYGTSRWRKDAPVSRAKITENSYNSAKKRADMAKSPPKSPKSPPGSAALVKEEQYAPLSGWSAASVKDGSPKTRSLNPEGFNTPMREKALPTGAALPNGGAGGAYTGFGWHKLSDPLEA